jgi:hypothetical protein
MNKRSHRPYVSANIIARRKVNLLLAHGKQVFIRIFFGTNPQALKHKRNIQDLEATVCCGFLQV